MKNEHLLNVSNATSPLQIGLAIDACRDLTSPSFAGILLAVIAAVIFFYFNYYSGKEV